MNPAGLFAQPLQHELLKRAIFTTEAECCEIMAAVLERSGTLAEQKVKVIEAEVARRNK